MERHGINELYSPRSPTHAVAQYVSKGRSLITMISLLMPSPPALYSFTASLATPFKLGLVLYRGRNHQDAGESHHHLHLYMRTIYAKAMEAHLGKKRAISQPGMKCLLQSNMKRLVNCLMNATPCPIQKLYSGLKNYCPVSYPRREFLLGATTQMLMVSCPPHLRIQLEIMRATFS